MVTAHLTPQAAGPLAYATGAAQMVLWLAAHWWLLALAVAALLIAAVALTHHLAMKASQERMSLELSPAPYFEPTTEEIFRRGVELARACTALPWWAPRRTKAVRIRLRADDRHPFAYRLEGPAGAERLLSTTPFGPHVRVAKASPLADRARAHEVRAEFLLRGNPVAGLREVPLRPDPLQPLVDAVADLRTDLGDLAEVCVDLQRAPKWALRVRRWQLMGRARRAEEREAARAARWLQRDGAGLDVSLVAHLQQLLSGRGSGALRARPVVMPPSVGRVDRSEALGKLAEDDQLVRVQILVRCASDIEGRAHARMARIQAGFDVFGGSARLAMRGLRIGPWRLGADRWPHRAVFDRRWRTGQCEPPRANWVRLEELTGLLKPPTVHCRLPLLPADLPTWRPGDPELLLQGWYRGPDGRRRLVATHAAETLYELGVGKSGGGKTELAIAQAIGYAHAGGGLLFIDPHRDSFARAAPYLAHKHVAQRLARIDLTGIGADPQVSSWNPIGMDHQRARHEVVEGVVDSFAAAFGWDDASAPRAIAILTAALTVLTAVNELACRAGRPADQATIFHVRALLTDAGFRAQVLDAVGSFLNEDSRAWWEHTFPTFPPDAFAILLNPLTRLSGNPVTYGFLGQGQGIYNIRAAMDDRMVVWVCTAGRGPTDRLVAALLNRDLLQAGRSRVDLPADQRLWFRAYFDELITLAEASSDSIASMFEDFRKYHVQIHALTQLLARLPSDVRQSLLQNASTLSTTKGSRAAIAPLAEEWGERPSAAEIAHLNQYDHYATFTVEGRRIGPVLIHGPHLDDVFAHLARPAKVGALKRYADRNAGTLPLPDLTARAAAQLQRVCAFLSEHAPAPAVTLTKNRSYQ
ncbi:ATP/GTP-binding protein [Streptomyces sp. NPDC058284]|uniref:ATP/GTP-binding protein n=1 Tax=unclassified Streptomyces TaxID=2593676 RepID=UPI00364BCD01